MKYREGRATISEEKDRENRDRDNRENRDIDRLKGEIRIKIEKTKGCRLISVSR